MDVLVMESINKARYRNQFCLNVSAGISNTIFKDLDKIFFITEIHCVSDTSAWSIIYDTYNTDSRLSTVTFDSTGDYYAVYGNEIVMSKLKSAIGMKYIRGFYVRANRGY